MVTREKSSQATWLVLGVLSLATALLCAIAIVVALAPHTPRAVVTFNRFVVDDDGKPQAMLTVTNKGRGTLRRWDFYESQLQGAGHAEEHHLGPDKILAPGDSETILIDLPSQQVPWKVSFHFSDYNLVEETSYGSDLPQAVSERLSSGKVDIHIDSKWITFSD